tara:strand:+ start:41407 stop:41670 length:264 start_codon:yes stop_codon:yes gene_type:complete
MAAKKGSKKTEKVEEVEEVEEVVKEVAVVPKGVLPDERDYNMPAEQFVTESWLALKGKEPTDSDMSLWVRKLTIEGQPRSELHRALQ